MQKEIVLKNCLEIVASDDFNPKFEEVGNIEKCADLINLPHEDYPHYVHNTIDALWLACSGLSDGLHMKPFTIRELHGFVFNDARHAGTFRTIEVHPEGKPKDTYLHPLEIYPALCKITPLFLDDVAEDIEKDKEDIILWYRAFQTIHPFQDGNGRVGGIIVAAYMYKKHGIWFAPVTE